MSRFLTGIVGDIPSLSLSNNSSGSAAARRALPAEKAGRCNADGGAAALIAAVLRGYGLPRALRPGRGKAAAPHPAAGLLEPERAPGGRDRPKQRHLAGARRIAARRNGGTGARARRTSSLLQRPPQRPLQKTLNFGGGRASAQRRTLAPLYCNGPLAARAGIQLPARRHIKCAGRNGGPPLLRREGTAAASAPPPPPPLFMQRGGPALHAVAGGPRRRRESPRRAPNAAAAAAGALPPQHWASP